MLLFHNSQKEFNNWHTEARQLASHVDCYKSPMKIFTKSWDALTQRKIEINCNEYGFWSGYKIHQRLFFGCFFFNSTFYWQHHSCSTTKWLRLMNDYCPLWGHCRVDATFKLYGWNYCTAAAGTTCSQRIQTEVHILFQKCNNADSNVFLHTSSWLTLCNVFSITLCMNKTKEEKKIKWLLPLTTVQMATAC